MTSTPPTALPTASRTAPATVARLLGYAGLVPFVGLALGVLLTVDDLHAGLQRALVGYGATILAFLGGIHWGAGFSAARPRPVAFAWGVVPSLLAWPALLLPAHSGLVVIALLLVALLCGDRLLYARYGLAQWLPLRSRLTAVAAAACLVAALGS